ncbi:MAG: penicillin-binding transpeptidase domain-containing protein [Actinomycetota bacterium]
MNRNIKILLAIFTICLLAVVVNLTWIQIFGAEGINGNAFNKRRLVQEYAVQRGDILSVDGQVLARSMDTGTEYRWQREYPLGKLFADVTGYDSWKYGRTGLEETFNKELLGLGPQLTVRSLGNRILGASKKGNSLRLSVDTGLQRTATEALGARKGGVVAMNPKTGEVLAMATYPTYDPNVAVPIPGRDTEAAWAALVADPNKPLFDRSTLGLYPPGSSFKVVTAAAALDLGVVNPQSTFDCGGKLVVDGYPIYDYGRRSHGEVTFAEALVVSCNITFAQVGAKVGASALVEYAELFGFNEEVPFDLPLAVSKVQPAQTMTPVDLAVASFGQGGDLATPLEMALVASTVANDGVMMAPYLVAEILDYNGKTIESSKAEQYREVIDRTTAETLTTMMVDVVDEGTGTAAQIDGVQVAGKTGTAEIEGAEPHAWFICFAPAEDPVIAVAVLVENAGEGGRVAAPIAREVLEQALK